MPAKLKADWETIACEYRAGQLSIREIGRQYAVSDTAIRKGAIEKGWSRALASKVREGVREALVRSDGSQSSHKGSHSHARARTDEEIVDAAAKRGIELVRQHRRYLHRASVTAMALLEELEQSTKDRDEIERAIMRETETDKSPKRRQQMLNAVSHGARSQAMASLANSLRALIPLERKAFSLDDEGRGHDGDEDPIARLHREISGTAFRPKGNGIPPEDAERSAIRPK